MRTRSLLAYAGALTLLLTCILGTSYADNSDREEARPIRPILVTSTRYEIPSETEGGSHTVIEREEIEAKNKQTVLELLRSVPGVAVVQGGGAGRVASVFIRGAGSNQTLVLIDGVRVNDTTSGQFDFAHLTTDNIERIEILRGSQSVLYGSEAVGGVIQIITRSGLPGIQGDAVFEAGSLRTQRQTASIRGASSGLDGSLSASHLRTAGISAASRRLGNTEEDGLRNFSASSRLGSDFLEDGRADLSMRLGRSKTDFDGFDFERGPVDALDFVQDRDTASASFETYKPVTTWLIPRVHAGFASDTLEGKDGDTEFNNFSIRSRAFSFSSMAELRPLEFNTLLAGFSYDKNRGNNKGNFRESRDVRAVFLQNRLELMQRVYASLGVRHDNDARFGEETTYRGALSALIPDSGSRIHSSYGTGFKAPSFNELFFPGFGNPDLNPERSWSFDAGLEQSFFSGLLVLDVTYFRSRYKDLIAFDTVEFRAGNIEAARVWGLENTLNLALLSELDARLSYTYQESTNEQTGAVLPRRPRHQGSADLFGSFGDRLSAALSLLLVRSRTDSDGAKMDNYTKVDLNIRYLLRDGFAPFLRVENLFDRDYEEIPGFGTPGLLVFGGLELKWD